MSAFKTLTAFFLMFIMAIPAQAATLKEVSQSLVQLQKALATYQQSLIGGRVLGVSTQTVSNATELTAALNAATGGETIMLNTGNYGAVSIRNKAYTATVTLRSVSASDMAVIRELIINNSANITLDTIKLDYVFAAGEPEFATPFSIENKSSDIVLKNLLIDGDVVSGRNAIDNGYANGRGLQISDSTKITVQDSKITRFLRGLVVYGSSDIKILDNDVNLIRSDGMNFVESQKLLIEGNTIHDFRCAPNSEDHADMIQFFTSGTSKPTTDVVIRNNTLDVGKGSWTQSLFMRNEVVDQGQAGAAMFYKNFLIEGNTISNAHTHGITMGEVDGLVIRNNTLNAAILNTGDQHNVNYQQQFGAQSGIMVPKLSVAANSKNVSLSGNTFTGGSFYTGPRLDPVIPPASWSVSSAPTSTSIPAVVPVTTLTVSPATVTVGGSATVNWSSSNATTCTASGAWSGSKSTSGSQSTGVISTTGTQTYTLTCTGTGGSNAKSVSVAVAAAQTPVPNPVRDTTNPVVTFTSPTNGSTLPVGTTATIAVVATDASGIGGANFYINDVLTCSDTTAPYTCQLPVSTQAGVKYTLTTKAWDTFNNVGESTIVVSSATGVISTPTPTPTPVPTTAFKTGDRVQMTKNVNVRTTGAVSATTLIGINPQGAQGTIIAGPTNSTESFGPVTWFNVNFDAGFDGWVGADNYLKISTPTPTPNPTPTPIPTTPNTGSGSTGGGSSAPTPKPTPTPLPTSVPVNNIVTTENLNVRSTAGGTLLGVQFKGATGVSDPSKQVTRNGTTWTYVNFTTGVDGYVSSTYLTGAGASTSNQALIASLLAQLAVLQAALAALLIQ